MNINDIKDEYKRLEFSLTNRPPKDDSVIVRFERVREIAKICGDEILDNCPAGRERSLAITKLEESVMWAIKSIALNQDEV